jgi:ABC-type multidrug transport system fused ATPase/permease subunit
MTCNVYTCLQVIVIAHRLSTVRDADLIAVVSGGSILDIGRHESLLNTCSVYANLVKRQLASIQGNPSLS